MQFGTTFSNKYCSELGLDPEEALRGVMEMIPFSKVRLCAYWDEIEPEADRFDFSALDKQLEIIGKKPDVVIVIGRKVPRWPEFHEPLWAHKGDREYLITRLQNYIEKTVEHYKGLKNLEMWQVENEPFVKFGSTKIPVSEKDIENETALVRKLDQRKIMISDSGEMSDWKKTAKYADIVGINMYTVVYDPLQKKYHYHNYSPGFYSYKAARIGKPVLIAELQCEPWGPAPAVSLIDYEVQKSISPLRLAANIRLAKECGFKEVWLWGTEWVYLQKKKGDNSYLEAILNAP